MEMDLINVLAASATNTAKCAGLDIPVGIINLVHLAVMIIQVVVPILLIIWGMIDFVRAITGGDEGKIKEGQKVFVKRLIAAVFVFLIVTIVRLVFSVLGNLGVTAGGQNAEGIWTCVDKFLSGV